MLLAGMAAAVALACFPTASALYHAALARGQASAAHSAYDDAGDAARTAAREQAAAYNARLAGVDPGMAVAPYAEQLAYRNRQEIAWVEVPRVGILQPVYRGTDAATLMQGAGHLEASALPVGGAGTRCIIAGHSGMRGAEVFDRLVELRGGDVFVLWTLGEPYAYRVCDVREVAPGADAPLDPQRGRDLCTLVTCTSSDDFSGSAAALNAFTTRKNDRRLLVTGERCAYIPPGEAAGTGGGSPGAAWPAALALGAAGALGAGAGARRLAARRRAGPAGGGARGWISRRRRMRKWRSWQ